MKIIVNDRTTYKISKREYTDEGFLKVPGYVARTGIQEYLAVELGLDGDPNRVVKVMRPADQVFDPASLSTYNGSDVTIEHPSGMVNADNYKNVVAGTVVSEGYSDGDFVVADLIIKSRDAIQAVESGKVQLSAGYSAVYESAPEGADYEFIQTDIKINHVALVDRARAGAQARIFDKLTEKIMATKVTLDSTSGRTVDIEDQAVAALVLDTVERLELRALDAEEKAEKAEKAKEKAEAEKDMAKEEMEEEKKKSSDSAIAEQVKAVAQAMADAKLIAGDKFSCDSVVISDIQRAALSVRRSNTDWSTKSNDYVDAAFDIAKDIQDANGEHLSNIAKDAAKQKPATDSAYAKAQSQWHTA